MSHELRTPMNGIFGMLDIALDASDDHERVTAITSARGCATGLLTIINDVLDFSLVQSGRLSIETIAFDPHAELDQVLDLLAQDATRKGIEVVVHVDAALPPTIQGDPTRFRQIVLNLAGNAVKFTEHGEVVIRLGRVDRSDRIATADDAASFVLRGTVCDTGIGISRDKLDVVFESFRQGDASSTRKYGGTGLGLAITKRLVEVMGGAIGVESEPGKGSTFWFELPCSSAGDLVFESAGLPTMRALVVDHHAPTRAAIVERFTTLGFRPESVAGTEAARTALAAPTADPFRLLVADATLPGALDLLTQSDVTAGILITTEPSHVGDPSCDAPRIARPVRDSHLVGAIRVALAGGTPHAVAPSPATSGALGSRAAADGGEDVAATGTSILVAEDDLVSRHVLVTTLRRWGFHVVAVDNGLAALEALEAEDAPRVALLDWMMPGLDGVSVCKRLRQTQGQRPRYLILLTAKGRPEDIVEGLRSGADDYVIKPFTPAILQARLNVGLRMVSLQQQLLDELARVAMLRQLEVEHRHAQKLEAVGRLASGIAHEINTPIQFVGDNTRFVSEGMVGLREMLGRYRELRDACAAADPVAEILAEIQASEAACDLDYLVEEIPTALAQTLEGVDHVAAIVRAMKTFAHPQVHEKAPASLNDALRNTLTVARNELKYVADVETDFGDIPDVTCNVGDLNQVFLNLLVNAAHAIADGTTDGTKGLIRVVTRNDDTTVVISISDTGPGISEEVREHIFEPFFTTKAAGRGTGQGLALARACIVDQHGGELSFTSERGRGSTFSIRLPIAAPAMEDAA